MRRTWIKIHVGPWLRGKLEDGRDWREVFDPAERSVVADFAAMAGDSPIEGKISIREGVGYTLDQLALILKVPLDILQNTTEKMLSYDMIEMENGGEVRILNWTKFQSDYSRQKKYRDAQGLQLTLTRQGDSLDIEEDIEEEKKKKPKYKKEVLELFDKWWFAWPWERRQRKDWCLMKFNKVYQDKLIDPFFTACNNYGRYIEHQREKGFNQTIMYSSTWMNNWRDWEKKKKGAPRL